MEISREVPNDVIVSKEVIGLKVINLKNEHLGRIEEIVLDKHRGMVRYVVLSFGGFFGVGDKFFAIPWKSINYSPADECFRLNIDKEKLKNAPGFEKDNWPNLADEAMTNKIHQYYGVDRDFKD